MASSPTKRSFDPAAYPDQDLTREIIGAFYYVYHALGYGFLESVYRKAMVVELRHRGIRVSEETPFEIRHRGVLVGTHRTDVIAEDRVIIETKTGLVLDPATLSQISSYLNAAKIRLGLVLHFGPTPQVKRLISSRWQLRDISSSTINDRERASVQREARE